MLCLRICLFEDLRSGDTAAYIRRVGYLTARGMPGGPTQLTSAPIQERPLLFPHRRESGEPHTDKYVCMYVGSRQVGLIRPGIG